MATERMTAIVGARISEFRRKMAEVNAIAKTVPNKIVTEVVVKGTSRARKNMNAMADFIRDFQTITGNMVSGGLIAVSPGIVPLLAGAVGAIAMLGAMGGVVAGSTFALATAFGAAGMAALAFGGIAIPTIKKLFDENTKLTKQQQKARKEFEKVTGTWNKIAKRLEKPVLDAFTKSMEIAHRVLHMAEPLFDSAAKAVNNLLNSLNKSLDSKAVKGFFDLLNTQGGPMLETLGKAFGNFTKGILSMMVAFGPLAVDTANGFLAMSQRFAEWAENLQNSKGFQSFVNFVKKNMPKVRAIFRDMTAGIVYMFSAFAPLSSDMLSGFQDMMARFKEWAKALPENPKFQQFIQYIRENGPKVLEFIGQLTTLFVNLGIALAPFGSKILELVNSFLAWSNALLENNPLVGKLIGGIIVAIGVFQALWPVVITVGSYFMGLFNILKVFVWPIILRAIPIILRVGLFLLRFCTGPLGFVIATVISLAIAIITNWDAVWSATKRIFGWVRQFILDEWQKIKQGWQILKELYSQLNQAFENMRNAVKEKMKEVYKNVKDILNDVLDFILGLHKTFYNAGKGLIDQMARGIRNAAGKVISEVKSLAAKARDYLPFSPAKVGPLSDIDKLNFGDPIADSIKGARALVQSSLGSLLQVPEIAVAGSPAKYDKNDNSNSMVQALENLILENKIEIDGNEVVRATGKPMMRYMKKETDKAKRGR